MKTKNILSALFMAMLMLVTSVAFTSCQQEELDTNQFVGDVTLLAYGPSPVARGGQLRFIGTGMDKVKSITLPGCEPISDIEVVSSEEIRITVPQNAQPGYPVLTTAAGKELTTETRLTYTEPVGFAEKDAMAPNPVKPGQKLTIKGEYLNLVQTVIFSEKVAVAEFEEHTREQIVLTVPAEAKTGKVTLSFCATGDTIPNEILSDDKLEVVLPAVESIAKLDGKKPGDKVQIKGTNFDLITALLSPTRDSLDFVATETTIDFTMPVNITNGGIVALTASGVEVGLATIGVALPEKIVITPNTDLVAGSVVTITGNNLDMVTAVEFEPLATAEILTKSATKIEVTFPAPAISGDVVLYTSANINVVSSVEPGLTVTTRKPVFESFGESAVPSGNDVVINGQYLDLVDYVVYSGGANGNVKEGGSSTCITVTMPASGAESGTISLFMKNGEVVETGTLTVNAPEFCYVTEWPVFAEDELLQAGDLLIVKVENMDKLTGVEIDGEAMQYITVGTNNLYIGTPNTAKGGSKVKLISSNGEIEYSYDFKPNTEIETVIWTGATAVGGWASSMGALSWGGYDWSTVAEGMAMRIYYTIDPAAEYSAAMRAGNGSWSALPSWKLLPGSDGDGNVPVDGSTKYLEIVLTAADLAELQNNGGLVVCGAWFIVNKVSLVEYVSLEETIWKGDVALGSWANAMTALSWGGYDWSTVKVGQTLTVYCTVDESIGYINVRIGNGSWAALPSTIAASGNSDGNYSTLDANNTVAVKLTQDDLDQLVNNGGLVVCGAGVNITKVTLL